MPITQWPAGPVPVIISELATGVTEGKLETTSVTIWPRSSRAAERRREVLVDRPQEHLGVHGVDYDEDELPRHG